MIPSRTAPVAAVAFLFALMPVLTASPASAAPLPDTQPPTRPNHLHVTAISSYRVTLAWNASTDNSGSLSYVIQSSSGYTLTVPQTSTSATFSGGLFPLNQYSFSVYAVDAAGNRSANSNSDRATLPADTSVPGIPSVTVTDVGPHHASFSWSSADNDPYLSYFVYINGIQAGFSTSATTGTFYLPNADTSYTITVRARDHGINFSPTSVPVGFTTDPVDVTDTQPPTTPAGFDAWHYPADRELFLSWAQSTDNVDAPQAIRYEIYINGELAESVVGTGATFSYGEFGFNVITILAIDSAGNESSPVTVTTEI